MSEKGFTHLTAQGAAHMVDVSAKPVTLRSARAEGVVWLPGEVMEKMQDGDIQAPKGRVVEIARIAGIQAAKRTGEWIPLCHPLGLDALDMEFRFSGHELVITAEARLHGRTGVEMEAMTAVSAAALTVYDMCKALSHLVEIRSIRLLSKSGGKNEFRRI